jgi:ubiquinol-cytochrome c reductase iron-sulfur subunit
MPDPGRRPTEPTGPSASREAFDQTWFLGWLGVALLALIALAVMWVIADQPTVLGLLGATAAGCVTVALHHLVVTRDLGERQVPRPPEVDETAVLEGRRRLFGGLLGGAAFLGLGGLAALIGFAPQRPEGSGWREGVRATTIDGGFIRPEDLPLGGVITVWPADAVGTELAGVMLLRLRDLPEAPTRLEDVVDETLVGYSRICTHAGCAVALYRDFDQALFCPCHQATFDARRGAEPVSGPASHPLPQLPLGIDDEGYVIATGDLTAPPGAVGGTV